MKFVSVERIIRDFGRRSEGRFCFCSVCPLHTVVGLFRLYIQSIRTGIEAQNLTALWQSLK